MAYRLLLQVPMIYDEEANVAVSAVGDAQVLVRRDSHGLGFDDPFVDLSIAAHSLRLIPHLYHWADAAGLTRPDSRLGVSLVLLSGRRIGFSEVTPQEMVAAIRGDQPWVEHTSPKIGEHEPNKVTRALRQKLRRQPALGVATLDDEQPGSTTVRSVIIELAAEDFSWDRAEFPMVDVTDIASAEQFYTEILGLALVARLKRDEIGNWREMPPLPDRPEANYHSSEADRVLLEHGPLRLALARKGHGARLDYANVHTHFSVLVEPAVLNRLKATALVRGYEVLEDADDDFTFRDPYGVAWSVTSKEAHVDF